MAKVPLPERGQPIDVAYLYTLANAVNTLSDQISTAVSRYSSVDTDSAGKQTIKTSDARVVAGKVVLETVNPQTTDGTKTWSYSWGTEFKYSPIVTATAVNRASGGAGTSATVVITSVTTSRVDGIVKFDKTATNLSVNINLMIVGIPN